MDDSCQKPKPWAMYEPELSAATALGSPSDL